MLRFWTSAFRYMPYEARIYRFGQRDTRTGRIAKPWPAPWPILGFRTFGVVAAPLAVLLGAAGVPFTITTVALLYVGLPCAAAWFATRRHAAGLHGHELAAIHLAWWTRRLLGRGSGAVRVPPSRTHTVDSKVAVK